MRPRAMPEELRTCLVRVSEDVVEGHVVAPATPERRFVVELVLNGLPERIARAGVFDPDLAAEGIGDGCYGFCFHLPAEILPSLRTVAVRLANLGDAVGETLDFTRNEPFAPSSAPIGRVGWNGGLRLSGWVQGREPAVPPLVEFRIDDARVAIARADGWANVTRGDSETANPAFDVVLPAELADGRSRSVEVLCDGRPLIGSPVELVAFPDGLEAFLRDHAEVDAEQPRGRLWDALFPGALPFDAFDAWEARFPTKPRPRRGVHPTALIVVGETDAETTLSGPGLEDDGNWLAGVLSNPAGPTSFPPGELLRFLEEDAADSRIVLMLLAGTVVRPGALDLLVSALEAEPTANAAYCDLLSRRPDGGLWPLPATAFDRERMQEQGTAAYVFALRREVLVEAAERGIDDLFGLFDAALTSGAGAPVEPLHVPGFGFVLPPVDPAAGDALAALARRRAETRGASVEVEQRATEWLPAVRLRARPTPRSLTLVVDAGAGLGGIEDCLAALEPARAERRFEVVVSAVDDGEIDEALVTRLRHDGIRLSLAAPTTSIAHRLAEAVALTEGDHLCFYDVDLRPQTPDWLAELTARMTEGVGAVGPVVSHASGVVAEAGRVLTPSGRVLARFTDRRHDDPGPADLLRVAHRVSAIGRTCLLTGRADFLALGGFDARLFPTHLGDVDYCLKLQSLGRRVVLAPDARLAFAGPRPTVAHPPGTREREEALLRARWPRACADDPFHNPLLALSPLPHAALAWPPRDTSARLPAFARARDVPPGA